MLLEGFRSLCIGSHCLRLVSIAFGLSVKHSSNLFQFLGCSRFFSG